MLKVLDKNGAGYTSDVIRAVDFAVANRASLGIDIINLSLGHPIFEPAATDPLVQAVERATRAGVIVVAAAGNYGKNPDDRPSRLRGHHVARQRAIGDHRRARSRRSTPSRAATTASPTTVRRARPGTTPSSSRTSSPRATTSSPPPPSKGPCIKTYPQLKAADGDYMRLSGTSMATAVTSGSIALMLEANRAANPIRRTRR